jgi:hypothetical protein
LKVNDENSRIRTVPKCHGSATLEYSIFGIVMFVDENTLQAALTSGGGLDTPPKDEKESSNLTLRYH